MKLRSTIILAAIPIALLLQGCGPSAKQLAEQQAQQKAIGEFHEAVAAVKVCTQDATYNEFREKRLALETCYTANQSVLTIFTEFNKLERLMDATDTLWREAGNMDKVTITSQKYLSMLQTMQDTMDGIKRIGTLVPANTPLEEMDQKAAYLKQQLDYLATVRNDFMKTPDFLARNPEAIAVYYTIDDKQIPLPEGEIKSEWITPLRDAMFIISPEVVSKTNLTFEQLQSDSDFNAENYVHRGLDLISKQCDELLAHN
jgi:hypothetical protein